MTAAETSGTQILVIEDDEGARSNVRQILESEGYLVSDAENGAAAMALLKQQAFDLIVSDYQLPDMTGLDCVKKALEMHPGTIPVFVTGTNTLEVALDAMKTGAHDYLIKPVNFDELLRVLAAIIVERDQFRKGKARIDEIISLLAATEDNGITVIAGAPSSQPPALIPVVKSSVRKLQTVKQTPVPAGKPAVEKKVQPTAEAKPSLAAKPPEKVIQSIPSIVPKEPAEAPKVVPASAPAPSPIQKETLRAQATDPSTAPKAPAPAPAPIPAQTEKPAVTEPVKPIVVPAKPQPVSPSSPAAVKPQPVPKTESVKAVKPIPPEPKKPVKVQDPGSPGIGVRISDFIHEIKRYFWD